MTQTPNKMYELQVTGTNVGTWGTHTNAIFSTIDNNLGGTLNISVAGNANINLTAGQASYLIHNLSGVLTGNIQYVFPRAGGFYAINNQTTGNFTITVNVVGGANGILVPQGTSATVYVDASVPAVVSFIGTQYNFVGGTITGTQNALVLSQTFPANFSLNTGTFLTITPTQFNTGSATLTTPDGSTKPIQKINFTGLSNLVLGDLAFSPVILQFNGTVWVALNIIPVGYEMTVSTPQSVTFGNCYTPYVNTAAIAYTIDQTTNLLAYWYVDINALGGAATIVPNAADTISVKGITLSAGASYVIPQGATARIVTDANGHLYINFLGDLLNKESTIASNATTDLGTMASNIGLISGTVTITSFGTSASVSNPFFITRFSGVLTLTNSANLIIPGGANYTTAAGDVFMWKFEGSSTWRCVGYVLANGRALVGPANATSSTFGLVKPDNITTNVSGGVISAVTPIKGNSLTLNPYSTSASGSTAHGLASTPNDLILYMECITNDNGFVVGQRVPMGGTGAAYQGATITVYVDSSNIYYATNTADVPDVVNPSTKARVSITPSSWKVSMTPVLN